MNNILRLVWVLTLGHLTAAADENWRNISIKGSRLFSLYELESTARQTVLARETNSLDGSQIRFWIEQDDHSMLKIFYVWPPPGPHITVSMRTNGEVFKISKIRSMVHNPPFGQDDGFVVDEFLGVAQARVQHKESVGRAQLRKPSDWTTNLTKLDAHFTNTLKEIRIDGLPLGEVVRHMNIEWSRRFPGSKVRFAVAESIQNKESDVIITIPLKENQSWAAYCMLILESCSQPIKLRFEDNSAIFELIR